MGSLPETGMINAKAFTDSSLCILDVAVNLIRRQIYKTCRNISKERFIFQLFAEFSGD